MDIFSLFSWKKGKNEKKLILFYRFFNGKTIKLFLFNRFLVFSEEKTKQRKYWRKIWFTQNVSSHLCGISMQIYPNDRFHGVFSLFDLSTSWSKAEISKTLQNCQLIFMGKTDIFLSKWSILWNILSFFIFWPLVFPAKNEKTEKLTKNQIQPKCQFIFMRSINTIFFWVLKTLGSQLLIFFQC